jgi:multidrug efflux system membrane fusion protein
MIQLFRSRRLARTSHGTNPLLRPFRARRFVGFTFPGLKPWAESSRPFGAQLPTSLRTYSARDDFALNRIIAICVLCYAFSGCNKPPPPPTPPPPPVTIGKPITKEIIEWDEYTGRTDAVESVDIRPRVSGYIDNITFRAGDRVYKGDLLFVIDPRPYQAALDQASAQLRQAQANQQLQDANFARQDRLRQSGVIAKEDYDTALSNKNQSAAQVLSNNAAVELAKLNLTFTQVTSPINGRISREQVTVGNLVQADSTLLTNIVSVDPIYAYFNVDERSVLNYQQLIRSGKMQDARSASVPVYLQLENETTFPHQGVIDFVNNQFNSSTGTLQVRGVFPNANAFLTPGSFVRVRVAAGPTHEAILVTDRAIGTDQGTKFVLVIDDQNVVGVKPVVLGPEVEGLRVVRSGLKGDEQIIINGIVNARPGSKVNPQPGDMSKFTSNQLQLSTNTNIEEVKPGAGNQSEGKKPEGTQQGNNPSKPAGGH